MSKKPTAALSANLVAVKGTAAPASDMPGRAGVAAPPVLAVVPIEPPKDALVRQASGERGNRRTRSISECPTPRREFKVYAAQQSSSSMSCFAGASRPIAVRMSD